MSTAKKMSQRVEFITPPNLIKAKVGSGGLNDEVIGRAQQVLEAHSEDFVPLAGNYLDQMMRAIEKAKKEKEIKNHVTAMDGILLPCVQLKANGAMFHYHLITRMADKFVHFMESVQRIDSETLEIAVAFHTTMHIVIASKIRKNGDSKGEILLQELESACSRYTDKYKDTLE